MFNKRKKQSSDISQLDNAPISTVIGADIIFKGDISGGHTIKIDGQVMGNIHIENGIILGEKALITGNIKSNNIIIYGTLIGNVESKELILKNGATVTGDIDTQGIEIEMGGKYNGQLNMKAIITSTENKGKDTLSA